MTRNNKIIAVAAVAATPLIITGWGRLLLVALVGTLLLPLWALALSSVFLIVCIAIGTAVLVTSNAVRNRRPAVVEVDRHMIDEDRSKAA
jgi:hypothetical protein